MKKTIILLLTIAAIIAACGDDNDTTTPAGTTPQQSITFTEVGHDDAHHAHPGYDMHLEATIVLPTDLISAITVTLTQTAGTYSFSETFTDEKYVGKHNADFHEHIDIPADAPLGAYQLTLTVAGAAGTRATATATVNLEEGGEEEDADHDHDHDHDADHDHDGDADHDHDTDGPDTTLPVISDQGIVANPVDCQVYHRGDTIAFCYAFADNDQLGNYNIEIHHNFDHHTHSTSAAECPQEQAKTPVSPWVYNRSFAIPAGSSSYVARVKIVIPATIDTGDYHFMIRLTDQAGWQQLRSMAIKIKE